MKLTSHDEYCELLDKAKSHNLEESVEAAKELYKIITNMLNTPQSKHLLSITGTISVDKDDIQGVYNRLVWIVTNGQGPTKPEYTLDMEWVFQTLSKILYDNYVVYKSDKQGLGG